MEKVYDLESRTEKFSLDIKSFCKQIKYDFIDKEYIKQLVQSAGSVAANYIEANENLGNADLRMRIKFPGKKQKRADSG